MTQAEDLAGWTPIRVHWRGEPVVEWCWLDNAPFEAPFFIQTVDAALRRPFSLLFRRETSIDALAEGAPGLAPNGFVFHVSRCGSTLVTQMLAAAPEYLALAEPLPVDDVLRSPASVEERARWLRLLVGALGRPRRGAERGYVLKLDAWSIFDLDVVKLAFPGTPWLFLYRDPLEVLASHVQHCGAHMLGAIEPRLFGIDPAGLGTMAHEEYMARVFAAICRSAVAQRDERALFLGYEALPGAVGERILDWFGLESDANIRERMAAAAGLDAKNPVLPFTGDSPEKAQAVTPALRAAVERWAAPAYEEVLRC